MEPKTSITKKEFDDEFIITEEITGETEKASSKQDTTPKPQTEPEFLTEEEEAFDILMHDSESQENKLE